jgi:succinate-acetate transporter protein
MGWGGAEGFSPVAYVVISPPFDLSCVFQLTLRSGIFFFVGPVLLVFAMVFEWVMGNFFPMMVMGLFAVFWLSFGLLQLPTLQLASPYATAADPSGLASPEYNATVALYLIIWGFALFTFFIFTLKINAVFAMIFLLVSVAAWVLSGAYWKVSSGDFDAAGRLQKVSGAFKLLLFPTADLLDQAGGALLFVVAVLGWYAAFIIMAGEMRITLNLPVGDLSRFWPKTDVELAVSEHQD